MSLDSCLTRRTLLFGSHCMQNHRLSRSNSSRTPPGRQFLKFSKNQPIEFTFKITLKHCICIHIHQSSAESDAAFVRRFAAFFSFWRLTALPPFWPPCPCSLADNLISVDWSKNVPGILTTRLSTTPSAWSSFLLLASSDAAMASAIDVAERQDVISDHWMPPMSCLSLPAQLAWPAAPSTCPCEPVSVKSRPYSTSR
jgi:hypothetical protein